MGVCEPGLSTPTTSASPKTSTNLSSTAARDRLVPEPGSGRQVIVVATKGFGKTLLLKAKRILYQRDGRATCLPVGNLLDKPIGDKVFGKEVLAFLAASSLPWSKLWLTAVAVTTLKRLGKLTASR